MSDFVVAITGACGSVYAVRLLQVLTDAGQNAHVTISPAAVQVFEEELDLSFDLNDLDVHRLLLEDSFEPGSRLEALLGGLDSKRPKRSSESEKSARGQLFYHHYRDFSAGIASGSFLTAGMVVCPCSMGTLASLANGISSNLIHRAADVHLKEGRKLILVPRETPLGSIQLENMKRLTDAGAVVLPAMPGFYHRPDRIVDLVDFVVARICDQMGVGQELFRRWGEAES